MKATGIIRRVDDLGRIVLPKEVRRKLGISEGTPMEIYVSADSVIRCHHRSRLYPDVFAGTRH